MRETSLDEFLDLDDGGADDGSKAEDDETQRGAEGESAVELEEAEGEPEEAEGEPEESQDDPAEPAIDIEDGAEDEGESGADPEPEPESGLEQATEPDPVEPAVSTYDWTPSGADCEACGTAVERRWRDDALLVCAECKAW